MADAKIFEILLSALVTIITGVTAWHLKRISELEKGQSKTLIDMQALKTNYITQFGEVKLKIEETKSLLLQESQTTRHTLRNEIQNMQNSLYKDFVLKEDCERHGGGS